jgi:hypothetical protein
MRTYALIMFAGNIALCLTNGDLVAIADLPQCQMMVPFSDCFTGTGCNSTALADCPKKGTCAGLTGNYRPQQLPKNSCHSGGKSTNFCDVWEDTGICFKTFPCFKDLEKQNCVPRHGLTCSENIVGIQNLGTMPCCTWGQGV